MKIQFREKEIIYWAERYKYIINENNINELSIGIKQKGYLSKTELITLCKWKSPRSAGNSILNSAEFVEEISKIAFKTSNERLRIEILTLLNGVGWPTASAILHFFHNDYYPILDYRALWSLGIFKPPGVYSFKFWSEYVLFCRILSKNNKVSMRMLDKALWQFSKENQHPG